MEKIKKFFIDSKTRIITSLVLIFSIFLIVYINDGFLTWLVLGLVCILGTQEACKLFNVDEKRFLKYSILTWVIAGVFSTPILVGLTYAIIFGVPDILNNRRTDDKNMIAPFLYPTIPMLCLYTLYLDFGMHYIVWLMFIVASTDTGAYVVGKFFGKTKFSPTSPNKTWEGVAGGVAIASMVGTIFGMQIYGFATSLLVSFFVSSLSIWGDLFESYLKREANVKDSGSLIPGHGGALDRLDGYLFGVIGMLMILEGLS